MSQKPIVDRIKANRLVSTYYQVYFPAYIIALLLGYIIGNNVMGRFTGKYGTLLGDFAEQFRFQINISLFIAIVTPILVISFSDSQMGNRNLAYRKIANKMNGFGTWAYIFIGLGIYYFFAYISRTVLIAISHTKIAALTSGTVTSPDYYAILTGRLLSVDSSFKTEVYIIVISFILTYISMDFIFRGLIFEDAISNRISIGGAVLFAAFIQAIAYSNSMLLFSNASVFVYSWTNFFLMGLFAGIVIWRTGKFWTAPVFSVLAFFLQAKSDFQINVLRALPEAFGAYNPVDSINSQTEEIANFLSFFQVGLIVLAPIIVILAYKESWYIIKTLAIDLWNYKRAILLVSLAFLAIDLIFSGVAGGGGGGGLGIIAGILIAMVIVSFVIRFLFMLLPPPDPMEYMLMQTTQKTQEHNPIDVFTDIAFLENNVPLYYNYYFSGIASGVGYLYLLFVSGAYRQFQLLSGTNIIIYILLFVLLPVSAFALGAFFYARAQARGYFFSENWRGRLFALLLILFSINVYVWIRSAALTQFFPYTISLFIAYAITIWPKPIRSAVRDFSLGLAGKGRLATFRWINYDASEFIPVISQLLTSKDQQVVVGTYIAAAKLHIFTEDEMLETLRLSEPPMERIVGNILALGIIKAQNAEGILLNYLKSEQTEVKKAVFWALGKVGSPKALPAMAAELESTPITSIMRIAEEAILRIDPNYPLSGLRDQLSMQI